MQGDADATGTSRGLGHGTALRVEHIGERSPQISATPGSISPGYLIPGGPAGGTRSGRWMAPPAKPGGVVSPPLGTAAAPLWRQHVQLEALEGAAAPAVAAAQPRHPPPALVAVDADGGVLAVLGPGRSLRHFEGRTLEVDGEPPLGAAERRVAVASFAVLDLVVPLGLPGERPVVRSHAEGVHIESYSSEDRQSVGTALVRRAHRAVFIANAAVRT